jgi:hypothetical protein
MSGPNIDESLSTGLFLRYLQFKANVEMDYRLMDKPVMSFETWKKNSYGAKSYIEDYFRKKYSN